MTELHRDPRVSTPPPATEHRRATLRALTLALATVLGIGMTVRVSAQTATSVHVDAVQTSWTMFRSGPYTPRGGNFKIRGFASAAIVDDLGEPVAGATVTGTLTFNRKRQQVTAVTDAGGVAHFATAEYGLQSFTLTFCVDDVAASLPYDPAQNVVTCHSTSVVFR